MLRFLFVLFFALSKCEALQYNIIEIKDTEYQTLGFQINQRGEVVGAFLDNNNKVKGGFLWSFSENSLTSLFRNSHDTYPISINDNGAMIGYGYTKSFRWKLDSSGIADLKDCQGKEIVRINNKGRVLESAHTYANYPGLNHIRYSDFNDNGIRVGCYYFDNRIVVEGKISAKHGMSSSINNYGTYVGHISPGNMDASQILKKQFDLIAPRLEGKISRNSHAFICRENADSVLIESDKIASYATEINDLDMVVGYYFIEEGSGVFKTITTRAFVYQNGKIQNLNDLISPLNKKITLLAATSINNSGMIVCIGASNGKLKTFLLVPK